MRRVCAAAPGLRVLGLAASLAALPGCGEPARPEAGASSAPRLALLLTVDTLRPDYLSRSGYDRPTTPFLDSLLERGAVFERAVAPLARTTQALASLLTGLYPHAHGVRVLWGALGEDLAFLPELAGEAGYATVAVVSNHLLTPERGLQRGFDVYDSAPDWRDAAATTGAVIARLSDRDPGEKLFLWVHYIDPHAPYLPPESLARAFDEGYRGRYASGFGARPGGIGEHAYPPDLGKAEAVYRNRLPEAVNAHVRRLYAADIRQTDDAIRELLTWLWGRYGKDWAILFAADHGESLGEHDYYFDHGDYVSNAELLVPLALVLPEGHALAGPRRIRSWVSLVDVMPTLAELLELPPAPGLEGRSLLPYLQGEPLPARPVFAESDDSFYPALIRRRVSFDLAGRFRSVIDGDWKLVWTPGPSEALAYQLYDLAADPGETRDLYRPDHPEARRLRGLLADWLRREAPQPPPPAPADAERLRALGYLE